MRGLTKNFELEVVTAADSKSSIYQMAKSVSFRNAADKIANKNKGIDVDKYPKLESSA